VQNSNHSDQYDKRFDEETAAIAVNRSQLATYYVVAPTFLGFIYVDYLIGAPVYITVPTRILVVLTVMLLTYLLTIKKAPYQFTAIATCFLVAATLGIFGILFERQIGAMYLQNGIIQTLIGGLTLFPFVYRRDFFLCAFFILLPYYILRPYNATPITVSEVALKIAFDVIVIAITYVNNRATNNYRIKEFESRQKLNANIQSQDQLISNQVKEILNTQTELKAKELEALNAKKLSELASQVAHDIRSPLTALNLVLSDLSSISNDRRSLVRSAVQRINDISNNLLSFRRNLKVVNETQNQSHIRVLNELLESVVSEKRSSLSQKQLLLSLNFSKPYPPQMIRFKPSILASAFSNFLQNAIEASPNNSQIHVAVDEIGSKASITISDKGLGIPEHLRSRLGHEPITFGKSDGNGLGVFNSVAAIRSIQGNVAFESSSQGTNVTIILLLSMTTLRFTMFGKADLSKQKRSFTFSAQTPFSNGLKIMKKQNVFFLSIMSSQTMRSLVWI